MNISDCNKPSKPRYAQSARAVFNTGRQAHTYRQPGPVYRDWSYRPERAIKDDNAATAAKEGV